MTTVHHPYDPRIYHKQCVSLQEAGYHVTLIAPEAEHLDNEEGKKPIHHVKLKKYSSRLKRMIFGTLSAYKQAKKLDADVYHFHDPELLPIGWLLKRKSNTVIYDIHEDYGTGILQKEYMSKPVRQVIAKVYKVMERFFSRNMELCLAEKYYQDTYPSGKCILNYPTINKKVINHTWEDVPVEEKLLYTGNVTEDRGALIHANIPVIDEATSVYFIGKCPGDLADKMYDIAGHKKANLQLEGIDRFVEKERIEAMYVNHHWLAALALFPPTDHYMKKELTKFFEYMSAGIPIICSDFPEWKKFIQKHECGIAVDPFNEKEIKQALDYLRNNEQEATRMGKNGKKAVKEELNWHTEEQKLINWYDLLSGNKMTYSEKDRAEH